MINTGDLNDFGMIPARKADYISHNKMESEDKSAMIIVLSLNILIAKAALNNEFKIERTFYDMGEKASRIMFMAQRLLEDMGYAVCLSIYDLPINPSKTAYTFEIKWEE